MPSLQFGRLGIVYYVAFLMLSICSFPIGSKDSKREKSRLFPLVQHIY